MNATAIHSLEASKMRSSHFFLHLDRIEQEIARSILSFGEKTKLRDACEYALTNGGKRFRPLIVLLIAEGLGKGLNVSEAALSVEFFHTASLIADDLPCMDNDDERRAGELRAHHGGVRKNLPKRVCHAKRPFPLLPGERSCLLLSFGSGDTLRGDFRRYRGAIYGPLSPSSKSRNGQAGDL